MKQPSFTDLIQPKDKNHELYKLIDQYLVNGDSIEIAKALNVKEQTVRYVARGRGRSKRIWNRIIKKVITRKEQEDNFLSYMKRPLPDVTHK